LEVVVLFEVVVLLIQRGRIPTVDVGEWTVDRDSSVPSARRKVDRKGTAEWRQRAARQGRVV